MDVVCYAPLVPSLWLVPLVRGCVCEVIGTLRVLALGGSSEVVVGGGRCASWCSVGVAVPVYSRVCCIGCYAIYY